MADNEQQQMHCTDDLDINQTDGNLQFGGSGRKKSTARMSTVRHAIEYNMFHKKRGLALIFNHEHFEDTKYARRNGTKIDCELLAKCLESMQFKLKIYNDCTLCQLRQHIKRASELDHSDNDCLLIAVLSYSNNDYLCARNGKYSFASIWNEFTADQCPTLAGKPKLFFIQACQWDCDKQATSIQTDGESFSGYKIPIYADFLIFYSTVPGKYGWKKKAHGSWCIQYLCDELMKNHKSTDILKLLTFVLQRIFMACSDHQLEDNKKRTEIPSIHSMLTRMLIFHEKQ